MNNFAVLDIAHLAFNNAVLITTITDNPCHLTCYYTDNPPLRHKTSLIQRGVELPWGAYFCFTAWSSVEQIQPGDTLSHTFVIPTWYLSQTKWFAFRGTVAAALSPSVSPIFKYEHTGQNLILNPSFETWSGPPGDAPDHWEYPPAPHHNLHYPDALIKTDGAYSCRTDNNTIWGSFRLHQDLPVEHLASLPLTFTIDYRGYHHSLNAFMLRVEGSSNYWKAAYPTLDYTWETLSISVTLPPVLTRLYLRADNWNQNFPLPFQTWHDNCQVLYTP